MPYLLLKNLRGLRLRHWPDWVHLERNEEQHNTLKRRKESSTSEKKEGQTQSFTLHVHSANCQRVTVSITFLPISLLLDSWESKIRLFCSFHNSQHVVVSKILKLLLSRPLTEVQARFHRVGRSPGSVSKACRVVRCFCNRWFHTVAAYLQEKKMCCRFSQLLEQRMQIDGPYHPLFARVSAVKILFLAASHIKIFTLSRILSVQSQGV